MSAVKMLVKGGWWWEKVRRGVRTVYFMVAMVSSLVVVALPVVVAIVDAVLPCLLISSFTCVKCYSFREHLHRYAFKSSLVDIPLVSIIRSLVIICMISALFNFQLIIRFLCLSHQLSGVILCNEWEELSLFSNLICLKLPCFDDVYLCLFLLYLLLFFSVGSIVNWYSQCSRTSILNKNVVELLLKMHNLQS